VQAQHLGLAVGDALMFQFLFQTVQFIQVIADEVVPLDLFGIAHELPLGLNGSIFYTRRSQGGLSVARQRAAVPGSSAGAPDQGQAGISAGAAATLHAPSAQPSETFAIIQPRPTPD